MFLEPVAGYKEREAEGYQELTGAQTTADIAARARLESYTYLLLGTLRAVYTKKTK